MIYPVNLLTRTLRALLILGLNWSSLFTNFRWWSQAVSFGLLWLRLGWTPFLLWWGITSDGGKISVFDDSCLTNVLFCIFILRNVVIFIEDSRFLRFCLKADHSVLRLGWFGSTRIFQSAYTSECPSSSILGDAYRSANASLIRWVKPSALWCLVCPVDE